MRLDELINGLGLDPVGGDPRLALRDLADDSRRVVPGGLFIARAGVSGAGAAYIDDALDRGAAALIVPHDHDRQPPEGVAVARAQKGVAVDHALTCTLAERFFDHPSRKLRLLGITGTNGKTTVAYLTRHLLAAAGVQCGLIGTIEIDDGSPAGPTPAELTTPGPVETARLLARMAEHGCAAAVMEVSSHALDQGRVAGLSFHAAVFTNLTGDHLDYHGTMDAYAAAKSKLFTLLPDTGWAVINADDPYAVTMLGAGQSRVRWTTMDAKLIEESERRGDDTSSQSFYYGKPLELRADGSRAVMTGAWGSVEVDLPLIGQHNVANALQAAALANCVTDLSRVIRPALQSCPQVPGRLELVTPTPNPQSPIPNVLVDYAHTHDALENVLRALRPVTPGRLIAVVGCGGDRDTTKRPKMAAVACELADAVWITSDNPRTEDPGAIIHQMLAGVPTNQEDAVRVEPDRGKAIAGSVDEAEPGDTVLIAGKGHEDYQIIADANAPGGTRKVHFDDREQARLALDTKAP